MVTKNDNKKAVIFDLDGTLVNTIADLANAMNFALKFNNLRYERIVVFSTHIIEDIASSCNNLAVLISGEIEYVGSPTTMAELAHDKVWEFHLDPEEFESEKDNYLIVHHMREGDLIRVKCLSEEPPTITAKQVGANLEDAYLWLMKSKNNKKHEELSPVAV